MDLNLIANIYKYLQKYHFCWLCFFDDLLISFIILLEIFVVFKMSYFLVVFVTSTVMLRRIQNSSFFHAECVHICGFCLTHSNSLWKMKHFYLMALMYKYLSFHIVWTLNHIAMIHKLIKWPEIDSFGTKYSGKNAWKCFSKWFLSNSCNNNFILLSKEIEKKKTHNSYFCE